VTFTLRTPRLIAHHPINLDNLLAFCAVDLATEGVGLESARDVWRLPVPLQRLWVSPDGLPMWAASVLHPLEHVVMDADFLHKRQQPGYWTRGRGGRWAPGATDGRFRERQIVNPVQAGCYLWRATGVGDIEDIKHLLAGLHGLGKRRNVGYGEILRVTVEPVGAFSLVEHGRLVRPLPVEAAHLLGEATPLEPPDQSVGWTPPYWRTELSSQGWHAGTPVA